MCVRCEATEMVPDRAPEHRPLPREDSAARLAGLMLAVRRAIGHLAAIDGRIGQDIEAEVGAVREDLEAAFRAATAGDDHDTEG